MYESRLVAKLVAIVVPIHGRRAKLIGRMLGGGGKLFGGIKIHFKCSAWGPGAGRGPKDLRGGSPTPHRPALSIVMYRVSHHI
jgi:hypothetical protein